MSKTIQEKILERSFEIEKGMIKNKNLILNQQFRLNKNYNLDALADNSITNRQIITIRHFLGSYKYRKNVAVKKVVKDIIDVQTCELICAISRLEQENFETLCGNQEIVNCPCVYMTNKILYSYK